MPKSIDTAQLQRFWQGFKARLLPPGGAAGQVLAKTGSGDYAVKWQTPEGSGESGSSGGSSDGTEILWELEEGRDYIIGDEQVIHLDFSETHPEFLGQPIFFRESSPLFEHMDELARVLFNLTLDMSPPDPDNGIYIHIQQYDLELPLQTAAFDFALRVNGNDMHIPTMPMSSRVQTMYAQMQTAEPYPLLGYLGTTLAYWALASDFSTYPDLPDIFNNALVVGMSGQLLPLTSFSDSLGTLGDSILSITGPRMISRTTKSFEEG